MNVTVRAKRPELLEDALKKPGWSMRMERGLNPQEEDDFTIFTSASQVKMFNKMTQNIKIGAFVIGIVALIVGRDRNYEYHVCIGDRSGPRKLVFARVLGAKRRNILIQFLMEAIILSNIGGLLGVLVGFGLGNIVSILTKFAVTFPMIGHWSA